jgi:hypothetical protein
MFERLELEAVQQRAQQFDGLDHSAPVLRAYLAGAFDEATHVRFAAPDSRRLALTDSKRRLVKVDGKQQHLSYRALIPAVGRFASLEGLTIGEVFGRKHALLDQFIDRDEGGKKRFIVSGDVRQDASSMYNGINQEAVKQRADEYKGLVSPPAVLRAYLAGAFDDVGSVTHATTGKTVQFAASKRSLAGGKKVTGQMLVPAVGEFAAFGDCTIATAFGVEHPLLDQFIKQPSVNSLGSPFHAIVSIASSALESARSSFYSGLTLDAVRQRAEMYKGLVYSPSLLRAYLAGAFDDVDSVTHAMTGEIIKFITTSKRSLVDGKRVSGQLLVPAVGEFAAFGRCTIATAFAVDHPLLDQFIKQKGVDTTGKTINAIVSIASSALESARSSFYSGLTLDAVRQRAEMYKGLVCLPAVLRAYLAGAFDDVDSVTHATTGKTVQFAASKRSLALRKRVTGQMLVPAVGEFAAFGRCTIATAFGVEHPLLDQFIKQTRVPSRRSPFHAIVSTSARSVKPRRTATSAKRRRGKSTATAPSHGLMTPLLLPPTTQIAKHAKLVIPPGHHPHPCATY